MGQSLEELLADAENPAYRIVTTARVLLRQDLARQLEALDAELQETIKADEIENREPLAPDLARRVLDLQAEAEAAKVEFKFGAIGHRAWADMMAKHPPTKDQAARRLDHNTDTMPAAAIAASAIEPTMALTDVQRLEKVLNDTQFNILWAACLKANIGSGDVPKSRAAGIIHPANGGSVRTALSGESPDQGSLDDN